MHNKKKILLSNNMINLLKNKLNKILKILYLYSKLK